MGVLALPRRSVAVAFAIGSVAGATLAALLVRSSSTEPGSAGTIGRIESCHDGDTCRLVIAETVWLNVRLAGIDAPEVGSRRGAPGQPLGAEAREAVRAMVAGQGVELRQVDLDQYNRPVVEVAAQGRSINLALLEAGMAEVYRGKIKGNALDRRPYEAAEQVARSDRLGIWGLADYVSPSRYRAKAR